MNMNLQRWTELNKQTIMRDKLARVIQYGSRALWGLLEEIDRNPALTDNFKTIEYIFSTFRKLLRFGKCLDVFYSSLRTIHYADITVRVTLTLSRLAQSLFLFADHILWLSRTGLFKNVNTRWWSKVANKYWLLSIIMNLCRDMYEIFRIVEMNKNARKFGIKTGKFDLKSTALQSYSMISAHRDVAVDTLKNMCDFFIPLTALGYTRMTPRTIGMLGAISSVAGIWSLIEPTAKLMPV